jgi:hypothetical protein
MTMTAPEVAAMNRLAGAITKLAEAIERLADRSGMRMPERSDDPSHTDADAPVDESLLFDDLSFSTE